VGGSWRQVLELVWRVCRGPRDSRGRVSADLGGADFEGAVRCLCGSWISGPNGPSSGPKGQPFLEPRGPSEELLARWAETCRWGPFPARWAGLGEWLALWAGPWLVLCPSVREFSDECPSERTQRSAPPLPCYWLLADGVLGGTPSGRGLCRSMVCSLPIGAGVFG
jgi:hypothetical protein